MGRVREMIALDTNILIRYLTCDDTKQFEVARVLLESLTTESSGYICRKLPRLEGVSLLDGRVA